MKKLHVNTEKRGLCTNLGKNMLKLKPLGRYPCWWKIYLRGYYRPSYYFDLDSGSLA